MIGKLRNLMLPIVEINKALPKSGLVYEIGSGVGSLADQLAKHNKNLNIVGIDVNIEKIGRARNTYIRPNLKFLVTDAVKFPYQPHEGAVMSDFLHHISYLNQEKLLEVLTKKLKKKGTLIIKEIAKDDGIFRWLSWLWDFLLYPEDRIYYRTRKDWANLLVTLGYDVEIKRAAHWFPGSTHLFVCRKK